MPLNYLLAILKAPAAWGSKIALKYVAEKLARMKASRKAMRGEDLASQASLHHLIGEELKAFADSGKSFLGLQPYAFRNWLQQGENVELFVEALIARAGGNSEFSERAERELAASYEIFARNTGSLADNSVAQVVSYVLGQLQATEKGKQALQSAIALRSAAQLQLLLHPEQPQFPSHADLHRVRTMATKLLEAGKRSWKMPKFIAPLTLEAHEKKDEQDPSPRPISTSELASVIETGVSLVLFGEGGIGKTTFLLELCSSCFNTGGRIPLFVDATLWARSNMSLLEYLAGRPSATSNKVTVDELTKLAEAGRLVVMLNGWNELPVSLKLVCLEDLNQLSAAAEALGVVVVSRSSSDAPRLPNARRVEVQGITWDGQSAVIRAELGEDGSAPLLDLLSKNTYLRHAARSPLILQGLIAQAKKGTTSHSSVFDLLGATVQAFEEDDLRTLALSNAPLDGHQREYLEELACRLTQRLTTSCSRNDALQAIHYAAEQLAARGLIGSLPQPTAILDLLASHHLLHFDDGVVRFAHQRFQEYFAATRLLRICTDDGASSAILHKAINQPAWDESLALVAGKLKGGGDSAAARVRIVKAAAAMDLGRACDLAGICDFSDADDSELHSQLVIRVNELASSPLDEVRDLGIAYQIASGFPAFAEKLWPLLESEDQQTRLYTYRLNGSAISLVQLGAGANLRVASWPSDRRVEFVHEIAENVENYEFLVELAQSELDPAVRAAAISALFCHFPASDAPFQAWLDAPIQVQTEQNVLSYVQYALEEGYASDAVRERLQAISGNDIADSARLKLALAFPREVGPSALNVIFEHLRSRKRYGDDHPLVDIARFNAPERLLDLALELALQPRVVTEWVGEFLHQAPIDVKTNIFERAWLVLQGQNFKSLSSEVLGPLASRDQTERSVASLLQYSEIDRKTLSDLDHERNRQLRQLLAHAPGSDLLNVVMKRAQASSYNEAAQLVELVWRRIGRDEGSPSAANQWLPTVDEVRQLVAQFSQKEEIAEVPQDRVWILLSCIASHVAPAEFGPLLLEACRRHLDAWSTFREKVAEWAEMPSQPRPYNPGMGNYLTLSIVKWGHDALPSLLELMAHPSAMEFIPEVIARIASSPWASKKERTFSSVSADIQEGEQRRRMGRVHRQPDDAFQQWTDEAARILGQKLSELVTLYQQKSSTDEKWNIREAESRVGHLAGVVARIPSARVIQPVHRALTGALMNLHGTVGALRGLVRQGLYISDTAVVEQLEALYEQTADGKWLDDQSSYAMSELTELLLIAVPPSLLNKPVGQYLQLWRRFSHHTEIIRRLGVTHSEVAWPVLLELGRELDESEELTRALVSSLAPRCLTEFLALIADGRLFSWCRSAWTLEHLAPSIATVLGEESSQVESFLDACRKPQSTLADALAGAVLTHTKGGEAARQLYLLEALDAGRAVHPDMPAYRMLGGTFTVKEPISNVQYEVIQTASNELRAELYVRAKGTGHIADCCRRLLASLECKRRETVRPDDEPRHPDLEDGLAWTDALLGR
ncbi:NACHT domain-containing protein [Stutzerimonas chloritidismutans]|uniref:NACHT domain-containing protein n=1 Tax=Stutzerimonas chloritidismutans TaxID=203192 RepID=UPI001D18530A|nr:hypothetical protein [Stutzerimonas chloritidismutans]UEG63300.1 hypothetical protein LLJ08_09265 [Stutzerimonas chloritidismutans]